MKRLSKSSHHISPTNQANHTNGERHDSLHTLADQAIKYDSTLLNNESIVLEYANILHQHKTLRDQIESANALDENVRNYISHNQMKLTSFLRMKKHYLKITQRDSEVLQYQFMLHFHHISSFEEAQNIIIELYHHIKIRNNILSGVYLYHDEVWHGFEESIEQNSDFNKQYLPSKSNDYSLAFVGKIAVIVAELIAKAHLPKSTFSSHSVKLHHKFSSLKATLEKSKNNQTADNSVDNSRRPRRNHFFGNESRATVFSSSSTSDNPTQSRKRKKQTKSFSDQLQETQKKRIHLNNDAELPSPLDTEYQSSSLSLFDKNMTQIYTNANASPANSHSHSDNDYPQSVHERIANYEGVCMDLFQRVLSYCHIEQHEDLLRDIANELERHDDLSYRADDAINAILNDVYFNLRHDNNEKDHDVSTLENCFSVPRPI